jgi:hypothetical protein
MLDFLAEFGPPASFLLCSCAVVDSRFPAAVRVFSVSIFCSPVFGSCGATGSISCLGFVRPKRRFAFLPVSARSCRSRFCCRRLSLAPWVHFSLLLVFLLDWSVPHAWISFAAFASRCCQFGFGSEKPTPTDLLICRCDFVVSDLVKILAGRNRYRSLSSSGSSFSSACCIF